VVELNGLWYELFDVASGDDVYAGVDTWEPFSSEAHVLAAGRTLAELHEAGSDFEPATPQPQRGFVVQLGLLCLTPVEAVELLCRERPAVGDYLDGQDWRGPDDAAYVGLFDRLRPRLGELPERPLHGDWQTNNLFFRDEEGSSIIDFHQSDYAPRVLDLAVGGERHGLLLHRLLGG